MWLRVCCAIPWFTLFGLYLCAQKKTKGPRAATRIAAPWRQGTDHGSASSIFPHDSKVNSQRQLGQQ
jgi:hypothetical protein